ncbi:MAG TPA: DUF6644 family protein [Vicinamibacterales bacterium]|jgi:hypothetical protein
MNLLPFFQWCEASALGTAIRESPWAFAAIESVHLLALAVIGGSVLLVDLRLLGLGLRNQPLSEVARDAQRWFNVSLAVMLVTGVGLFSSEPTKCYYSTPFWVKMWSLLFAILFSYTVKYRIVRAGDDRVGLPWRRAVAIVSLALWFAVGAGGRWIGFSG